MSSYWRAATGSLDRRRFLGAAVAAGGAAAFSPYGLRLDQAEAQALPLGVAFDPAPFTIGVASGDPTADSVILWTRLVDEPLLIDAHERLPETVEVSWAVAEDPRMTRVVRSGTTTARRDFAHTVHVDPGGLEPGRWYFYQFSAMGRQSRIGRTKTAGGDRLKMAFVGCAKFHIGFFGAYRQLCQEDIDLVFCSGDYFYEESFDPDAATDTRREDDLAETETLEQYRRRFALYRGDPNLRQAHALFPWVVTWDDHEFDNNYAGHIREDDDGPGQQSDNAFLARQANSYQAYYEMMPIRPPAGLPAGPEFVIHRTIRWGDLLDLIVLDTRQFRTDQPCGDETLIVTCSGVDDPDATILGMDQKEWVKRELSSSTAAWRTLGQQVLFSAIKTGGIPDELQDGVGPVLGALDLTDGNYINADQWDGYTVERRELLEFVRDQEIPDLTVLTGDIHSTWVSELRPDFDNPTDPSVGVEFCGTSITSDGLTAEQQTAFRPILYGGNPHLRYVEVVSRGYMTADITPERWIVRMRTIDDVYNPRPAISTRSEFVLERGSSTVTQTTGNMFN